MSEPGIFGQHTLKQECKTLGTCPGGYDQTPGRYYTTTYTHPTTVPTPPPPSLKKVVKFPSIDDMVKLRRYCNILNSLSEGLKVQLKTSMSIKGDETS